jgi:uncharacterized membrane protein YbhN (UPF0104 family)/tRNA A-37 threonylcarbamoyl transferase component Bud32
VADGPSTTPATGAATSSDPVTGPRAWRAIDLRVFASVPDAPRARRPTDAVLLVGSTLTLLGLAVVAPAPVPFDEAARALAAALPLLLGWFWEIGFDVLLLWSVVLVVAAVLAPGRRPLVVQQAAAVVLAFTAAAAAGIAAGTDLAALVDGLLAAGPPTTYPQLRVALASAAIVATSPHLTLPLRHIGRWVLAAGGAAALVLGAGGVAGLVAGLAVGVGSAALVHLVFGSPGGRLPVEKVIAALADLHVPARDLRHADLAPRGVALLTGHGVDGRRLVVKVYGRDAWDGQLISSVWSSLWYRDTTPSTRLNRLQQVEHEAFATLLAERAGVPVLPVVAAGLATGRDAVLVVEADARPLTEVGAGDAVVAELWSALRTLHRTGIAHGRLTPDRLVVRPDGTAALADFGAAVVAAGDTQLLADRAELLVSSALLLRPERAVAVALAAIGPRGLAEVLPLLQPAAIEPTLRRDVRDAGWSLTDLRELAAREAGAELPELEKLRRVSVGSVVQVTLIVAVAYVILSAIAGIGWDTLVAELRSASLGWVVAAILLAPAVQVGQAFSTLGATERPVRFGPVLALQYATQFLALAVPSSAARIALAVRFFQKAGATTTAAAAVGLIDSLSGFAIQALIILVVWLSGVVSLAAPSTSGGGLSLDPALLALVAGGLVLVGIVALSIPRVRGFLRARAADSRVALTVLRSRRNLLMLFGGNLASQALFAAVLGLSLLAFGERATFAELLLVNTLVSLFAGLVPVPGGIGVTEAALTTGLVAIGVPSAAALSAALVYRLATYYLPPVYGAPAMRWLRANSYI